MEPLKPTDAGGAGGHPTVIVARYKFDMGIRFFMAMLILLMVSEVAFHAKNWLAGLILLPALTSFIPLLTNKKIELVFAHKRYRIYRFRWMVGRYGYKNLPGLDHILLRDVTLSGSFTDQRTPIGDTYGYELALVDQAHERMIVCIRYSENSVRAIAHAVQRSSGLRLEDATDEHLVGDIAAVSSPPQTT